MSVKVGDRVQRRYDVFEKISFSATMARGVITKIELDVATVDWKLPRDMPVPDAVPRQVPTEKLELVS